MKYPKSLESWYHIDIYRQGFMDGKKGNVYDPKYYWSGETKNAYLDGFNAARDEEK